jgi:hypothetical protein
MHKIPEKVSRVSYRISEHSRKTIQATNVVIMAPNTPITLDQFVPNYLLTTPKKSLTLPDTRVPSAVAVLPIIIHMITFHIII